MIGYKIVRNIKGKHYSLFHTDHERVQYTYRKKTVPHESCPPLFVFTSLQHAQNAYYLEEDMDIYQCRYEAYQGLYYTPNGIVKINVVPNGTVLADSVTLLKLIR